MSSSVVDSSLKTMRQPISMLSWLSQTSTPSSESSEVRWMPASEATGYTMDHSMRTRINDFLTRHQPPVTT
jgi:hypothetical protein